MWSVRNTALFIFFAGVVALAQNNPVPYIDQPLVPSSATPGRQGFTLTVRGANFAPGAAVYWNNEPLLTSYVSPAELTASVNPSNIATAGTAFITVLNPSGSVKSNVAYFPAATPIPTIQLAPTPAIASDVQGEAIADFNGDGKLDLVLCSGTQDLLVFLGNGNGTFQSPVNYEPACAGILVGDFNGDGKLDLVNGLSLLLGNGNGTFQPPISLAYLNGGPAAIGDFNGDGKLDLILESTDSGGPGPATILIALGNGDGTFQQGTQVGQCGIFPGAAATADLRNNGKLDLLIVHDTISILQGGLCVFLSNGDGTFTAGTPPDADFTSPVAVADVNGDSIQDLVFQAGVGGDEFVALGNGDGTFQSPIMINTGGTPYRPSPCVLGLPVLDDFYGNGKLDLAAYNCILPGNGNGTFQLPQAFPNNYYYSFVDAGDFNGDGRLDLLSGFFTIAVDLQVVQPIATLSPTSLNFGNVPFAKPSPPQTVTLQNTGGSAMTITSIGFTGANASEFSQTNNCGSSLVAGAKCVIKVTFTPNTGGSVSDSLSISDNTPGSPQSIVVEGTGQDFSVTPSPTSLTVTPGQAANYTLTVAPVDGFEQTVSLSCSGAPAGAMCTVTPVSVTLNGTSSATADVAVVTTAATAGMVRPVSQRPVEAQLAGWITLSGIVGLAGIVFAGNKQPKRSAMMWTMAFLCLVSVGATMLACGGGNGGSSSGGNGSGGTPTGNYILTVTGTYGSGTAELTHSIKLTLVVQ
jgi:hypothetical protein